MNQGVTRISVSDKRVSTCQESRTHFAEAERYSFDWKLTGKKGWAQVDTVDDGPWYGTWLHPQRLRFVEFIEGELIVRDFDSMVDFVWFVRGWVEDGRRHQKFKGIDTMCNPSIRQALEAMGLDDACYPPNDYDS